MAVEQKNVLHAAGSILGTTGARISGQGFSPSRSGVGIYPVTLDLGVDATECVILACRRGTQLRTYWAIEHDANDRLKTFRCLDAGGAALDCDFDFLVVRTSG